MQRTYCWSHNNSGRLQYLSLINGQIMESETKQKLRELANQLDLTDIYTAFYPKTKAYTFFSVLHGTFSKTDHILCHKTALRRYKKIVIIPIKLMKQGV